MHGITNEFLADKPLFTSIAADFFEFVEGAELIIHNAPFDVGFLDAELQRLDQSYAAIADVCGIVDTLVMARGKHPGQRNNLDALCQRYMVDNSQRDLHGALLDAEILADVYLAMTGGQTVFQLSDNAPGDGTPKGSTDGIRRLPDDRPPLAIVTASDEELAAHEAQLDAIAEAAADGRVLWRELSRNN